MLSRIGANGVSQLQRTTHRGRCHCANATTKLSPLALFDRHGTPPGEMTSHPFDRASSMAAVISSELGLPQPRLALDVASSTSTVPVGSSRTPGVLSLSKPCPRCVIRSC